MYGTRLKLSSSTGHDLGMPKIHAPGRIEAHLVKIASREGLTKRSSERYLYRLK
jgi:hypothetical protein